MYTQHVWRLAVLVAVLAGGAQVAPAETHLRDLRRHGREPVAFVADALDRHDLVIFDDALHSAAEPWDYYEQLLRDPRVGGRVRLVFVEVLGITDQPQVDAYLDAPTPDRNLLAKAFQDDYSGFGWRYETCLQLLESVRQINRGRPAAERIRVIAVNPPIYWEALHTRRDYDLFQDSLVARDYFMYRLILARLNGFRDGTKAFFLTNTRHAYKGLRARDGTLHWNTAAFFDQHHPGKAYSVRIHNVTLHVEAAAELRGPRTAEGLERYEYRWVRMEGGAWDRAFASNGDRPIALPLPGTAFGRARYVGNSMHDARADQTMADAYDALVFLAPLERLHLSAKMDFFYTPAFRQELKRRLALLEGERLPLFLQEEKAASLDQWVERFTVYEARTRNSLVDTLKP